MGSDRYFGNDVLLSEDMLIDLYEAKIGDGWREDGYFLYVLKTLGGIELGTWDSYTVFEERLLGGIAEKPELIRKPPLPFIRDGRPLLGEYATLTDPDTGLKYSGGITFDYDFEAEKLLCSLTAPYFKYIT